MENLILEAMNVKQLSERVVALENEVKALKELINDLKEVCCRADETKPVAEEDDGSWYSDHGHGD